MKTIQYEDWLKKAEKTRKASFEILSHFDLNKLRKKPRDSEEEKWLKKRGIQSRFDSTAKTP